VKNHASGRDITSKSPSVRLRDSDEQAWKGVITPPSSQIPSLSMSESESLSHRLIPALYPRFYFEQKIAIIHMSPQNFRACCIGLYRGCAEPSTSLFPAQISKEVSETPLGKGTPQAFMNPSGIAILCAPPFNLPSTSTQHGNPQGSHNTEMRMKW